MSKLSFRARALDASKPMPIYMSEELPDLPEYSAINRAVPQMPSGMEKEEECEHHLQRAICAGLIIPTPEVNAISEAIYNKLYPPTFQVPKKLIHMQPFAMEQDIPDYDMDSEDEKWVSSHSKTLGLNADKFEEIMDRLEKNSGHSVVTQTEAKMLFKEDDDLIMSVYDYWLNKRLRTLQSLIPTVKTDQNATGTNNPNPYIAFRRRTEKMQTRKNRKNDEASYEKMIRLQKDLNRALMILELVKRRENSKRELLHLSVEVYEKRYQLNDFNGQILAEVSHNKNNLRNVFTPIYTNHFPNHSSSWVPKPTQEMNSWTKEKRQYKKRKHKAQSSLYPDTANDDDRTSPVPTERAVEDEESSHVFRRNSQCSYQAPIPNFGNWPWCSSEEGGYADKRYRYSLTSISRPHPQCIGFARRRVGRGGRVILDRVCESQDDYWAAQDFKILERIPADQLASHSQPEVTCFRPLTPEEPLLEADRLTPPSSPVIYDVENLLSPTQSVATIEVNFANSSAFQNDTTSCPSSTILKDRLSIPKENGIDSKRNLSTLFHNDVLKSNSNSGSLLDRWAKYDSSVVSTTTVKKCKTFNVLKSGDPIGCSVFETTPTSSSEPVLFNLEVINSKLSSPVQLNVSTCDNNGS